MINSVSVQSLEFFKSALLGVALGVFFDILRTTRFYMPKIKLITVMSDIFFWIMATVALLAFVLTVSGGRMRWYVLLGVFCGGFVYSSAVSGLVFKIFVSTVLVVRKAFSLITKPIYIVLSFLWRKFKSGGRTAEKKIKDRIYKNTGERREKRAERRKEKKKEKKKEFSS